MDNKKACPGCGKAFVCKAGDGAGCWGMELPPALPVADGNQCFCPHCLSSKVEAAFKANPEKKTLYLKKAPKGVVAGAGSLREGRDYYINDEGNWVFTAFYHLKKGYCCQNGCKHCPYGFKKQ